MDSARTQTHQLVEEGAAFAELHLSAAPRQKRFADLGDTNGPLDVVVIGGGQAGLSVGHHLAKQGLRFVILDANERVGDSWRKRWDSLRLFSPACLDGLDGMPFPAEPFYFPTKDEMGDYLESYARRFELPVKSGTAVTSLRKRGGRFVVGTAGGDFEAAQVVIAMSSYQRPRVPEFASGLRPDIVQLHSSAYRNPAQLREGAVLLAGAGNSGSEIAVELGRLGRVVWMAGRDTGHVPFKIDGFWAKLGLLRLLMRVVFHRILTIRTPMGQRARVKFTTQGGPLIRVRPETLAAAGVRRALRVVGVRDGLPLLDDGRVLDVANVVWCTGFHPGFSFVELPIFGEDGQPRHDAGVCRDEPGLYFVGLNFLYAASSTMVHGVGRDAERIVRTVAARAPAARAAASEGAPETELAFA